MTDVQQEVSSPPVPAAETPGEMPVSPPSPLEPGTTIPGKNGFEIRRDRLRDRQAELDHHRDSVLEGVKRLTQQLDRISEENVTKRLGVRGKITIFEQQLAEIAEEQAHLDRQKEAVAREEEQSRIEDAARTRQEIQTRGAEVATNLRQALAAVGQLFAELAEFRQQARVQKDIIRSLAPGRMTENPDFDWAVGVDANFQRAIGQVVSELHRSLADLQRRPQAKVPFESHIVDV